MVFTDNVNVAFYYLIKNKTVVFMGGESIIGTISVGDNSNYYNISYIVPKEKEQKIMFGHIRIIDFMKNHSPRLSFTVSEEAVKSCEGRYFEIEYLNFINANPYFTWKNIKEPIKSSDLTTPFEENTITVLRAYLDLERTIFNNFYELEARIRQDAAFGIEEISYADVGRGAKTMEDALKDINNKFNDYIKRVTDSDYALNVNFIQVSERQIELPRTSIIGWMMRKDFEKAINKSINNNVDFGKFYISQFLNIGE